MKFELTLSKEDYLYLSLFVASKSKLILKRRRNNIMMIFGAFMLISISSYLRDDQFLIWWVVLTTGLIFTVLYTFYQRNLYIKSYKKSIAELYKNRFGKSASVEFSDQQLLTSDYAGESKLNFEQLEHIYETDAYFLMKFATAEGLIIPKSKVFEKDLRLVLNQLAKKYAVPFSQELKWKFK